MTASLLPTEVVEDLESIRDEWDRLALAGRNIFATWEWHTLWWEHFAGPRQRFVGVVRRPNGDVAAIVPLVLGRAGPLRVARLAGHGPGDQLGTVCRADDRALAVDALNATLAALEPGRFLFLGEQLRADVDWLQIARSRVLARAGSPVVRVEQPDWETYLATRSPKLRADIRYKERKLHQRYTVLFRLSDDAGRLVSDLDTLFRLHRLRFGAATTFANADEPFQRAFAERAFEQGWLRLWTLELDGTPAAAWYGFRYGGAEAFYQGGWDPRWRREAAHSVLTAHTIRSALEDGVREYRFLRGDEQYKYRLATDDPGLVTIGVPRDQFSAVALAGGVLLRGLRRRLVRRGGVV